MQRQECSSYRLPARVWYAQRGYAVRRQTLTLSFAFKCSAYALMNCSAGTSRTPLGPRCGICSSSTMLIALFDRRQRLYKPLQ